MVSVSEAVPKKVSPKQLLRLYMGVVLAAATIAIAVLLYSASRIDDQARASAGQANAAIKAAQIQAGLAGPILQLTNGYWNFFLSPTLLEQPQEVRERVRNEAFAVLAGLPPSYNTNLRLSMNDKDLLALKSRLDVHSEQVDSLLRTAHYDSVDLSAVRLQKGELLEAFDSYLGEASLENYNLMFSHLIRLSRTLSVASDSLAQDVLVQQDSLRSSTNFARIGMILVLVALTLVTAVATIFIGRMIHRVFSDSESEHVSLRNTSNALRYRNEQLTALYNVFTEITETLSLRYVIKATLRESLKVMNANMIVLRLLRGDELVVVGNLTDEGTEIPEMEAVSLGDGPTGRAARRGRTVRIHASAQEQLGPTSNPDKRVESGIVVPLIVGARVVGTIACWSHSLDAFTEEDERVLEMMASQVATAVVAADTTDSSEHRAHHDPLTGLPNRLQLHDDRLRELDNLDSDGRSAVVAMADIDHFKRFNDEFGHRVGDVTLQKVASVLRNAVRDKDRVYRYGGEEFVLVFMDAGADEAVALAERVRAAVERTPLSGDQLEPVGPVTISIGLANLPTNGTDFGTLVEMADMAMYRAKQAGRNRVVMWTEDPSKPLLVA